VALDYTSELLKAASSNVLRFKIDTELPKVLADKARITGRIVQFPAHDALEIEQYLAQVREAGLVARDVEIRKSDLEDVFLAVMAGKSGSVGVGARFDAGPPQGEPAPSGGSAVREATSVGARFDAGPPQGEPAPSGGSAVREATSVGAIS
jgi:ABC-2 type transport system ATP-binding protein